MDKIIETIRAELANAALTPTALEHINKMLKEAETAHEDNKRLRERIHKLETQLDRLANIEHECLSLKTKIGEVESANNKMAIDKAASDAKANTVFSCFELVFRNAQVHESVTRSVPVPITHSNGSGDTWTNVEGHQQTESITREEK